jgi:signal transduction histidine kinase
VWFWYRFVPGERDVTSVPILNWIDSVGGRTTIGLFALVTLPWVARGLVVLQQAMGEALLGATDSQRLHAEVNRLETQGRVAASAEAQSLRKIERDLHDGPQQRLIRLAMDVQQAEAALEKDPEAARLALASARVQSAEALAELRQLTRGIAPPILVERGLAAALESLAERGTIPVDVDVVLDCTLGAGAETALYFVASESLANLEKHANASEASVTVRVADGKVTIVIADNGVGGAHPAKGRGLAGLADRVEGAGGTLTVADAPGGGTIVTAEVPCG